MWRDRDFRRLWVGQTVSQLGEHTTLVVLPLCAVLTLGAGAGELGVLRAVGQAPILLLSLLVGAWVDRWRTRTVMVLADVGRTLALGAAAVAWFFGALGLPALLVAGFAVGALSVFFDVAYQASLVRLVKRDQLVRGNSALEGSRSAAQIAGPALGGALVSLLSAPIAAASSALLFALSFLSIRRIRRSESIPEPTEQLSQGLPGPTRQLSQRLPEPAQEPQRRPPRVWRRIGAGLRFVIGDTSLRAVCLASAAFQFSLAATTTVYLLFLPRELRLSGTEVGLVLAAAGPGALLGSLLAARLPGRFGHGVVLVSAAALGDGAFLCVPALHGSSAGTVLALVAVGLVFGTFGQLVNVTVMAVRQALTPDGMQGRAAATITFVGMGLTPLGSLLGGFLADEWGPRLSLAVTAAGMLLSPLLMALSPLARLGRTLPARGAPCPARS
ncbi:MFS transporter [Streptomyces sp. NPDC001939]|uniref:MFS transporter n=1 Tax=unclassified Streptomyces TaxID=2593676 RepID=UPI00224F222A|nr:MFS transporter [Streptomyces sp. NBC_00401]MCX5085187.1 MFS transporter [Streptomyces sp. NBC_00401]